MIAYYLNYCFLEKLKAEQELMQERYNYLNIYLGILELLFFPQIHFFLQHLL